MVAGCSSFYLSRPANKKGTANSAFVKITLETPQPSAGIEVFRHVPAFLVRAIVGTKKDYGVRIDLVSLKCFKYPPDPLVKGSHHSSKLGCWILCEGLVVAVAPDLIFKFRKLLAERSRIFFRNMHGGVRDRDREKAKEGFIVLAINPLDGLVHDEVVSVGFPIQFNFTEVVKKPGGIVGMRVSLAVVAKEAIESLMNRVALGSWIPKAPFPKGTGGVASVFEGLGNCEGLSGYRELPHRPDFPVSPTGSMPRMEAGHDDASSWGTYR